MDLTSPASSGFQIFQIINTLVLLGMLTGGIYLFVLVVKLARIGIKALDIYIDKNRKS